MSAPEPATLEKRIEVKEILESNLCLGMAPAREYNTPVSEPTPDPTPPEPDQPL